jgi:hypothetical protein
MIGMLLGRRIADRRTAGSLYSASGERVAPYVGLLIGVPLLGAVAGALLLAIVNPGPGLVSAVAQRPLSEGGGRYGNAAVEGAGALVLSGLMVGTALGLLLTGRAFRRRAEQAEPVKRTPRNPHPAVAAACLSMGLASVAGACICALGAWLLFGLADPPLELVRDRIPLEDQQWDWLNEARHVLVGSAVGFFGGLVSGRVRARRPLRAAGLAALPLGQLRRAWRWLVGMPLVTTCAVFVLYEQQNPDRIFDETLPVVWGLLSGLALEHIAPGLRLRRLADRSADLA